MLLALVGYLGVSGNAWLGKASWSDAMGVGGDAWAAVLGSPIIVDGVAYRAVPTLMTLAVVGMLRALLLPGRRFPAAAQWMAVPTFALTSAVLVASTADHVAWFRALPGAVLVPLAACLWAVAAQTDWRGAWGARAPWLADGLIQARGMLTAVVGVALAAFAASLWVSRARMVGIQEILLASTTDSVVLVIAQVLVAPTGMAWALSWLAGPGFLVGADALHTPALAPVAPIPALPLLGAVPQTAPGRWVVALLVATGAALGVWVRLRHRAERPAGQVAAGLTCLAVVTAAVAAWFWLSVLHLGVDRMAVLGPRVGPATLMVLVEVVVTAQLVALAAHPAVVAGARRAVGRLIGSVRARTSDLGRRSAGAGAGAGAAAADSSGGADHARTGPVVPAAETSARPSHDEAGGDALARFTGDDGASHDRDTHPAPKGADSQETP